MVQRLPGLEEESQDQQEEEEEWAHVPRDPEALLEPSPMAASPLDEASSPQGKGASSQGEEVSSRRGEEGASPRGKVPILVAVVLWVPSQVAEAL